MTVSTSNVRSLRCGVPQGSVFGPLLFFNLHQRLPSIPSINVFVNFWRMTQQSIAVQSQNAIAVNSLLEGAEYSHMFLHPDKTKFMRQKRHNLTLKCTPIFVGNQTVNAVDNHKVLGVTIDCNLSWSRHVTASCKSTSKKIYQRSEIKLSEPSCQKIILSYLYSIHRRLRIDAVGINKCRYSQTLGYFI